MDRPGDGDALTTERITWEELQSTLAAVEPAAVLVASRYLRRVIRLDRDLPGFGLQVPHRKSYVVDRERARESIHPDESPALHSSTTPPIVILLAGPSRSRLQQLSKTDVLLSFSRRLFHARIDFHFKTIWLPSKSRAEIRRRISEIGQAAFDEIRAVLRAESYLLPPFDDGQVYAEFAAVFFEMERFAPKLIHQYFPTLSDVPAIAVMLRRDCPADGLFERSKLPEAKFPNPEVASASHAASLAETTDPWSAPSLQRTKSRPLRFRYHRIRAARAARQGNDVRCALQNIAAYRIAPLRFIDETKAAAVAALKRLTERLARGVHLEKRDAKDVERLLPTLLPSAADGFWTESAKLLYDLQAACVDLEREHFTVDVWSWLFSFGRTPIRRKLPLLPEVLAARHLRSAARRIARIPLPPHLLEEWLQVVRTAAHAADEVVRKKFGPILTETLRQNGFSPTSAVERIAFDKMTGDLLDIVVARGRFSLGDLRDVVARNDFKLADVKTLRDLWDGDSLLRANRALATTFDGVYRGGDFYLRWLLQFTSLAYGTRVGRFLTMNFALPLGGAVMVVEGLQHTIFVLIKLAFHLPYEPPFVNLWSLAMAAGIIYGCIHSSEFASRLWAFTRMVGRSLKLVLIDWPARLLSWPSIQRFLHSPSFVLLRRAILYPLLAAYAGGELAPALVNTMLNAFWPHQVFAIEWPQPPLVYLGIAFICAAAVFLSPLGRRIENYVFEQFLSAWRRFRFDVVPGLIRVIMEFFQLLLEGLERLLYAVDERLRFHTGETRLSLFFKATVGAVWLIVENAVRALVNLAIEPQVNPVKHFPVVTVSHKIMIPAAPAVTRLLSQVMGTEYAVLATGFLLSTLPGVCGFLAWELLTNWRLYEATRPEMLRPRAFGSHGETMVRMLRPGFHSGTVPKLFSKLRRARRAELRGGSPMKVERLHDELHHVADAVQRFVRRELLRTLVERSEWRETSCTGERVTLASNRIVIAVDCPLLGEPPLKFAFEEQSGWLAAGIVDPGWLVNATPEQRSAFEWALAGFYKRCGVSIVREQLEAAIRETIPNFDDYDVADAGLLVWPVGVDAEQIVYELGSEIDPVPPSPESTIAAPTLSLRAALLSRVDLTWVRWTYFWNSNTDGAPLPWKLLPSPVGNDAKEMTPAAAT
jgi:hypothetical protein